MVVLIGMNARLKYHRWLLSLPLAAGWAFFLVIGMAMTFTSEGRDTGTRTFGLIVMAGSLIFVVRSLRLATIVADKGAIIVRTMWWTYRLPISALRGFKTVSKMNLFGWPGRALAVEKADGTVKVFGEFFAFGRSGEVAPGWIEQLASDLNRHLDLVTGADKPES